MRAEDKYNRIVEYIEAQVEGRPADYFSPLPDPGETVERAFESGECAYVDERARNEIFKFLIGCTLKQYLNRRLMMRAYRELLEQEEYNPEPLINLLGVSSESTLYKKFKETFGMSPREAFEKKDRSLYEGPALWPTLGTEEREQFRQQMEDGPLREDSAAPNPGRRAALRRWLPVCAVLCLCLALGAFLYAAVHRWAGEYVAYDTILAPVNSVSMPNPDKTYRIYPLRHKVVLEQTGQEPLELPVTKFGWNEIRWRGEIPYLEEVRTRGRDGVLTADPVTFSGAEFSTALVPAKSYEKWRGQWDGDYALQVFDPAQDADLYLPTATAVSVSLDFGRMLFIGESESDVQGAFVRAFNGNTLTLAFDEAPYEPFTLTAVNGTTLRTTLTFPGTDAPVELQLTKLNRDMDSFRAKMERLIGRIT